MLLFRPAPSAAAIQFVSEPPTHFPLPLHPHHSASQNVPNTSPYPMPKCLFPATHRKALPPSSLSPRNRKSRCWSVLSPDQSLTRAVALFLPPNAAHFHGRSAISPAIFPAQSIPPLQSPPPAASPRQTSSGKSAPSQ